MIDITIVDKNNETKMAEGLLYFNVKETNKKYLIYTLNEPINDKIIIYAINIAEPNQEVIQIDEETSKIIKEVISKVSNGTELDNIEFLNMTNVSFSVGNQDAKKFGISPEKKQTFVERQLTSVANKQKNDDTPVVGGSSFFNADVATPNQEETPIQQTEQVNIFDNPMQPEYKEEIPTTEQPANEAISTAPVTEVSSVEQNEEISTNIEQTPAIEQTPVVETPVVETPVVVNETTEKTMVITQEQLDIITKAIESINSVINNIKVVDKEEINQELPSLPQEVVQETQSEIPTGNVLVEESVLTPNNEIVMESKPEETPIVESIPQIVATPETVQLQPVGEAPVLDSAPVIDQNTPVIEDMAVAPSLESAHPNNSVVESTPQIVMTPETVQLQPVGEAPVLGNEVATPIQEVATPENVVTTPANTSVQEVSATNNVPAIEVVSSPDVTQSVSGGNVSPVVEQVPAVETQTIPTAVETESQDNTNGIDLEVYLPDMPALNDLENSPILAETGQPENEANQAVQIGSRPTNAPVASQEIPAIEPVSTVPVSETGEKALENAMDQIDNNNYVASAGNSVTVQNPSAVVQGDIPVVMPTGSSAPVQSQPTQEIYGPGSLTPETPVGVQNSRPIEGLNAPQEQPKALTLAA